MVSPEPPSLKKQLHIKLMINIKYNKNNIIKGGGSARNVGSPDPIVFQK